MIHCPRCHRAMRNADDHDAIDCNSRAGAAAISLHGAMDEGARAWQRGYSWWHTPDYCTRKLRQAWKDGWTRAELEFT